MPILVPGGTTTSATGLASTTTTVDTSAAAAPSAGQILTAISSTNAEWATPSSGHTHFSSRVIGTTSGPTTTSATFATMPQMTTTVTTTAASSKLQVIFNSSINALRNDDGRFRLQVNGSAVGPEYRFGGNGSNDMGHATITISELVSVTAGTQTITIQWRAVGGTVRAYTTARTLVVVEVP
jgi:hypothetical protein